MTKEKKVLSLYLISQTENNEYDSYDSAVVVASSEYAAKRVHPGGPVTTSTYYRLGTWVCDPEEVTAKFLGVAATGLVNGEVVCASFNAG